MKSSYRGQAADATLALAERIKATVDVASALETAGASIDALVATAEASVGAALRASTERTVQLPSARRDMPGHVPVARTFGRGTEADAYEILDGAPVGTPESLAGALREARAIANENEWHLHNARAESGLALTRAQRRNRARAARRTQR